MTPDLPLFPDLLATPSRFLWHPATQTAILADVHLGAFAPGPGPQILEAWKQLSARSPRRVIVAGDLFDQPVVPQALMQDCRKMLGTLPHGCRVTVTPGNHDPADLGPRLGVESVDSVVLGTYLISHGHVLPEPLENDRAPHETAARAPAATWTWIVGHQHPAVTLRSRVQAAKMACYVRCASGRQRPPMLLLPAFSRDAGGPLGGDLLRGGWLLPMPRPAPHAMHAYGLVEPRARAAQVLDFGMLDQIAEMNGA